MAAECSCLGRRGLTQLDRGGLHLMISSKPPNKASATNRESPPPLLAPLHCAKLPKLGSTVQQFHM